MFRDMRRKKQQLPKNEAVEIIQNNNTCVMALNGDDGFPYAVPISYAYFDGKFYMHGAKMGHKVDSIKKSSKVSLCIINDDTVIEEKYTNKYKSVIVFGEAKIIYDVSKTTPLCRKMTEMLCPNAIDGIDEEIKKDIAQTAVIEITPSHITGKEGLEFFKLR